MSAKSDALAVGRVVRPHGVRGELVVEVLTDSPELRFAPGSVLGTKRRGQRSGVQGAQELIVVAARQHAGRLLLRVEGVNGREAAEDLRNTLLTVSADEAESGQGDDEFHDIELTGLRVVLISGEAVGEVRDVLHGPAGDLLSVRTLDEGEALIPFVTEIVPEVDLEAGTLTIDPPEGLLE